MKKTPSRFHCVKCGHEWVPQKPTLPLLCPQCHCRKWHGGDAQGVVFDPAAALAAKRDRFLKARRERTAAFPERECLRCGYKWQSEKAEPPARCPQCKTNLWNVPRKTAKKKLAAEPKHLKCLHCGHEWTTRYEGLPKTCPECNSPAWDKAPRNKAGAGRKAKIPRLPRHG